MALNGVLNEPIWGETAFTAITNNDCNYGTGCGATDTGASAQFKAIWNSTGLWIGVVVNDPGTLYADAAAPWNGSAVEIFLDVNHMRAGYNAGTGDYDDPNTYQFGITYNANSILEYHNATAWTIMAASTATQGTGYTMEIEIPWANLGVTEPTAGSLSGLDVAVDVANAAGTARDHQIAAYNAGFNAFDQAPAEWGTIAYQACNSFTATNTPVYSATPTFTMSPTFTITPLASATPTPAPYGATLPYTEYEAENANYTGTLIGPSTTMWEHGGNLNTEIAAESSGREAVQLTNQGQYVRFTTGNQCNSIVVREIIPDAPGGGGITATLSCVVNGPGVNFTQELNLSSAYSWDYGNIEASTNYNKNPGGGTPFHLYDETHALFGQEVPAGSTITLQKGANDTAAYYVIDFVDLEDVGAPMAQPGGSISVTSYGATGNGNTDDTNAIQNCINNAAGRIVWFPQGNYRLSNQLNPGAVTLAGAGMWYTTLHQTNGNAPNLEIGLNNASMTVENMFLQGEVTNRNDGGDANGLDSQGGNNSVVRNVWIEHTKCGWWCGNGGSATNNLLVTGCRIRDTYADGINITNGGSNSTVTQCNLRNTGDDSLAVWSQDGGDNGNTFSYNTIQNTWRADGLAFYGGSNNNMNNNLVKDTLDQSGIMIEQGFGATGFGGTNNFNNNVLIRCGGTFGGTNYGAVQLWANQGGLGGTFSFQNDSVQNSTFDGVVFTGGGANGGTFNGLTISNSGNSGINAWGGSSGSAYFANTVVTGSNGSTNNSGGAFTFNRGAGDVGW
jgi:hypothetical protein